MTDRRADLSRGEIQHSLPVDSLHKRPGRPAHNAIDELPPIANQQTYAVVHLGQATAFSHRPRLIVHAVRVTGVASARVRR